jgi:four helix bundle protein
MQDFKKLLVWRKAHALALNADRLTGQIRRADRLTLRSQILRASMSIPANIVEGRAKSSEKEFARFLKIALSSSAELEYHLIVAKDLRAIDQKAFLSMLEQTLEIRMMLHGLLKRIAVSAVQCAERDGHPVVSAKL